jgi:hypothetical protein
MTLPPVILAADEDPDESPASKPGLSTRCGRYWKSST